MFKLKALLVAALCVITANSYAMQDSPIRKKHRVTVPVPVSTAVAVSAVSALELDLLPDPAGFSSRTRYCGECQEKRADLLTDALYGSDDEVRDVVRRTSSMEGRRCFPFRCETSLLKVQHRAAKQKPQNQ